MYYKKLAESVRVCGSTPKVDQCRKCPYWADGDMSECIPRMTADAATAITALLARAEAAEARAEKAEHDMKRIVNRSSYPCEYCTKEKCFATDMKRQCYDFVWDGGKKEE